MIYLIRHGETVGNAERRIQGHNNGALNDIGKRQATETAKALKPLNIHKIFTSDLTRAVETAQIINEELNVEIVTDKRLREICFGRLDGRLISDITDQEWADKNDNPHKFGAESREDVFNRIKDFFDNFKELPNENYLVVSHAGAIRMMIYCATHHEFCKREYEEKYTWEKMDIKNTQVVALPMQNSLNGQ